MPGMFKSHKSKTPKGSGLGLSFFIITSLFTFYYVYEFSLKDEGIPRFYSLLLGFIFLFLISLYDDYKGINPFVRLFIQITICFLSLSSLPMELWGTMNQFIPMSKVNWLLIIYFWLFIINLTNFFDGVDFIITIKLFFVSLTYALIGFYENNFIIINLSLILCLSSILLSYFNLHPAKFFLGDSGSIPLGFLLGWLFIYISKENLLIECLIINLPHFIDIIFTEIKKLSKFENIFIRHRDFRFQKKYDEEIKKRVFYQKYIIVYCLLLILSLISYFSLNYIKLILLLIAFTLTTFFLYVKKN